jgi:hypothetical protein
MTLGNSSLPQPQAWQSSSFGSTACAQLHGTTTAADQQGQQQQPLLQQLVQQNQQLQQVLQQQKALMQGQEVRQVWTVELKCAEQMHLTSVLPAACQPCRMLELPRI